MNQDTIVAIATPPGRGGVGILRLSGPDAYVIASKIHHTSSLKPRYAAYCPLYGIDDELVDQGLVLYFKAPHSFTGEDVIEIQAHGSPVILDILMQHCCHLGARLARPGEFSERAFLNNKIDLTQAEAIADLIQASSEKAARMALRSLQGDFSHQINELNQKIIALRLYVEAAIDFPEEEIDFLNDGNISERLKELLTQLQTLRSQASQGVLMREGLALVIAGKPNAGKSTLMNQLAGRDVSIVTEIAGTTRDVMKEHILLDDIPLHLIDTAGLHHSQDKVEQEGIRRAFDELNKADCILLLVDIHQENNYQELRQTLPEQIPLITVFNKIDTATDLPTEQEDTVLISAKTGLGIDALKALIKTKIGYQPGEGLFLARRRHLDALDKAHQLLLIGQQQLHQHQAGELLAEDLRLAHQTLGEITGVFTSDDLLGVIFSSFCIGK